MSSSSSHHPSPYLLFPPSFSFTILPLILLWPPPPFYPITLSSSVSPPSLTILSFSHLLPMQTGPPGQIQPELWSTSLAPPPWCPVGRGTYRHTRPPGSWHDYQWCVSQTLVATGLQCAMCNLYLSSLFRRDSKFSGNVGAVIRPLYWNSELDLWWFGESSTSAPSLVPRLIPWREGMILSPMLFCF